MEVAEVVIRTRCSIIVRGYPKDEPELFRIPMCMVTSSGPPGWAEALSSGVDGIEIEAARITIHCAAERFLRGKRMFHGTCAGNDEVRIYVEAEGRIDDVEALVTFLAEKFGPRSSTHA